MRENEKDVSGNAGGVRLTKEQYNLIDEAIMDLQYVRGQNTALRNILYGDWGKDYCGMSGMVKAISLICENHVEHFDKAIGKLESIITPEFTREKERDLV